MMWIMSLSFIWIFVQAAILHIVSTVQDDQIIEVELCIDVPRRGFFQCSVVLDHVVVFGVVMIFLRQSLLDDLDLLYLSKNFFLSTVKDSIQLCDSVIWEVKVLFEVFADADGAYILSLKDSSSNFTPHYFLILSLFLLMFTIFFTLIFMFIINLKSCYIAH